MGPTTDATAVIVIESDMYIGRFTNGTKELMIIIPPEKNADTDAPVIARPMMKTILPGAVAVIIAPSIMRATATKKIVRVGNRENARPKSG